MAYKRYIATVVFATLLLGVSSCITLFVNSANMIVKPETRGILLLKPTYVYRENLKLKGLPDSVIAQSDPGLLHGLSDSLIIEEYYTAFANRLTEAGFKVFTESDVETFLGDSSRLILLNISQISLEEYLYQKREQEAFEDTYFYQDFMLNAISMNVWIEYQKVNMNLPARVLFASSFISDKVEGKFQQHSLSGKVVYNYTLKSLQPSAAYTLARQSGLTHADYFFDLLLNHLLEESEVTTSEYVHYNQKTGKMEAAGDERFFEIK
jgi:hypothetical protein